MPPPAQITRRQDEIDRARREEAAQWQRVERELHELKVELPQRYVQREDYMRGQSVVEAKLDALALKLDNVQLFLPYQARWIADASRLKLMEKSRQIGLSWSTAYACAERTAMQNAKTDQWVSSRDDLQARLFIEDCKMWAGLMNLAAQDLGEQIIDPKDKITAYVLQFASRGSSPTREVTCPF